MEWSFIPMSFTICNDFPTFIHCPTCLDSISQGSSNFFKFQLSSIVRYFQISFCFFKKKTFLWKILFGRNWPSPIKNSVIKRVNHKESTFKKPSYLKFADFGKLSLDLSLVHLHYPFPHLLLVTSCNKVPQVARYQANKHGMCHTVAL